MRLHTYKFQQRESVNTVDSHRKNKSLKKNQRTYQPISVKELKSDVIAGVAVDKTARSRKNVK